MMNPKSNPNGNFYLHLWRKGCAYEIIQNLKKADDWNNLQFSVYPFPDNDQCLTRDVRKGIPFLDNSFHVVYAQRIIEHLTLDEGRLFLKELYRVLKPGGILRICTPNLLEKAMVYLESFDKNTTKSGLVNYDEHFWNVLELIDQASRRYSGGLILDAAKSGLISEVEMKKTGGDVYDYLLGKRQIHAKHSGKSANDVIYWIRRKWQRFIHGEHPQTTREAHMWMYDAVFLKEELDKLGFKSPEEKKFNESEIPSWYLYAFDTSPHGEYVMEPSLFMEAKK